MTQRHCQQMIEVIQNQVVPSKLRTSLAMMLTLAIAGCSALDAKNEDYKRSNRLPPLEIPPSLTVPQADDRYSIPDPKDVAASATYSEYAKSRGLPTAQPGYVPGIGIDPKITQAHIERAGSERWLVINGTEVQVYNTLKTFLTENGYDIAEENPILETLETKWVTSRPHVEDDGLFRNLLNSVLSSDTATSIRDRYHFRVDPGRTPGTVEVYVSHSGLEEVQVDMSTFKWQPRPSEPTKEAEMLKRLLVKFGIEEPKAAEQMAADLKPDAKATATKPKAATSDESGVPKPKNALPVEVRGDGQPVLRIPDSFDRAWRRMSLAVDKSGLLIQDQNRDQGIFFVQYASAKMKGPDPFNPGGTGVSGFFSSIGRMFTDDKNAETTKVKFEDNSVYRIIVTKQGDTLNEVSVMDKDGKKLSVDLARRFLEILANQPY
jgi:outer membrane protein assembly factor BamC